MDKVQLVQTKSVFPLLTLFHARECSMKIKGAPPTHSHTHTQTHTHAHGTHKRVRAGAPGDRNAEGNAETRGRGEEQRGWAGVGSGVSCSVFDRISTTDLSGLSREH